MAKKLKILLVFISLSLTLCLMSNTYSRYVADATSNLQVLFAKWQILVNSSDITNGTSSAIALVPVIEANNNVATNTVAPSSKGYFDINIDPSNVDLSFNYTINLAIQNKNVPDLMITKYAIIDSNYVEGTPLTEITLTNNIITGSLNYDKLTPNFKFKAFTIRVYFEWYEGVDEKMNDTVDTAIGNSAATTGETFTVSTNITFEQKLN